MDMKFLKIKHIYQQETLNEVQKYKKLEDFMNNKKNVI